MSEFFGNLETELRAAAERKPRRAGPGPAVLAGVLLAVALAPIAMVLGSGDDESAPERRATDDAPRAETTVVATGVAPVSGKWQLQVHGDEPGACLRLTLLEADPERDLRFSAVGPCAGGTALPAFNAQTVGSPSRPDPDEYIVYGRTPEDAVAVRLTKGGEVVEQVDTSEGPDGVPGDFYVMYLAPDLEIDGRMEWLDRNGTRGDEAPFSLP